MAEASLPMLPWFPGDFMKSTRGWSITAKGLYRELLDLQWEMGPLPKEPEKLQALAGATDQEWAAGWPYVGPKFPVSRGRCRANVRLEIHRSRSQKLTDGRKKGAEITNLKRYGATRSAVAERPAQRSHPIRSISDPIRSDPESQSSSLFPESNAVAPEPARAPRAPARRLPADFGLTLDRRAYAESHQVHPERAFENFTDYWRAASGSKATKHDWDATWRMWVRNEAQRPGQVNKIARRAKTPAELEAEERNHAGR
jgi:uncharacterized protein YdaU (DUF1376 family)